MAVRILVTLLALCALAPARVVVYWQAGFPTVDSEAVPRETLEQALNPEFTADPRPGAGDLLVLPYGSAVPVAIWSRVEEHLRRGGSLLIVGGRPLWVPVTERNGRFMEGRPQPSYARLLGIGHTYEAPQRPLERFAWDDGVSFLPAAEVRASKVHVVAGASGIGYFLNGAGEKIAAPVTRRDFLAGSMAGARCVFLNFAPAPGYWPSGAGIALIRAAGEYAAQGAGWLRVEVQNVTVGEGEAPQAVVQARDLRGPAGGSIRVELLAPGGRAVTSAEVACSGDTTAAPLTFPATLPPGLYTVRATWPGRAVYTTGFWKREPGLLESGPALGVSGDYFTLGGAPFVPWGTNYFTTDTFPGRFDDGGNAYVWDRDFAEMARHGVTFVRTGIWGGHADLVDRVTGGAEERVLRSLEAYLACARRHNIQVHFTFFAFDPQTIRRYPGQESFQLGPGANPYTDPVALRAQKNYVLSIVQRFRNVPSLSWDLINEPSYSNPKRPWRTVPNGDPTEIAAWNQWLEKQYGTPERLADAWSTMSQRFGAIPLPNPEDLELRRYGSAALNRALDFNLFAQSAFNHWAGEMVKAIRSTGSRQLVTVGQDEGGVTNRPLNQFYGASGVDFTVNHSWWQDDALLWDSVAGKRPGIPNLIGETGVQPVWRMDGTWRWDEVSSLGLLERKLALGLAAANSGSLQWDWGRGDTFGIKRSDGSNKVWVDLVGELGEFAKRAAPYLRKARPPETAIVLPQSLQLSVFNRYALEAQQKSVRALYHYARGAAYVTGEYQVELLGNPKLIILPAPWVLAQPAWDAILARVRAGATLLVSGRFDLDEHFRPVARELGFPNQPGLLDVRDATVSWPEGEIHLTYSGDKCTYLERGSTGFVEQRLGDGRVLYFGLPLELNDSLEAIGLAYRHALAQAHVAPPYETGIQDRGILICPTSLEDGTLYVLTSESARPAAVAFRDTRSGKVFQGRLEPGRAALLLVRTSGELAAAYNWGADRL